MSFYTGTGVELLYCSNSASGATLVFNPTITEQQVNTPARFGVQAHLPPDFWLPNNNQVGRGIRIVARGSFATTTGPNFGVFIRAGAAGTGGPMLLGSAASTATLNCAAATPFALWGDVILTAIGAAGGNSSFMGRGTISSANLSTPADIISIGLYGGGTSPGTVATLDTSITNYISFNASCSAANAGNSVTLNQLLVYGLN